jgi:hypothetical protein
MQLVYRIPVPAMGEESIQRFMTRASGLEIAAMLASVIFPVLPALGRFRSPLRWFATRLVGQVLILFAVLSATGFAVICLLQRASHPQASGMEDVHFIVGYMWRFGISLLGLGLYSLGERRVTVERARSLRTSP